MNVWLTIAHCLVGLPNFLPMTVQALFKIVVWPWDLKYFNGFCTLRKGFPNYRKSEVGQIIQMLEEDLDQGYVENQRAS